MAILSSFQDGWLYHLTVVSGGGPNAGTQYEQLVQKLMELDGDPSKHMLLYFPVLYCQFFLLWY